MLIYIINYNNYYNRIVRKEQSLVDYITDKLVYTVENAQFNPNDGINTTHVIGTKDYDGKGDYAVITDAQNNIVSRWFIIEAKRQRGGQWNLTLRRDVFVDYGEQILSSTVFVEKGTVPETDSAIFNSEEMTFNQIKTSETLLKDESYVPWIVGYYDRKESTETELRGDVLVSLQGINVINLGHDDITNWDLYKYVEEQCIESVSPITISTLCYNTYTTGKYNLVTDLRTGKSTISKVTTTRAKNANINAYADEIADGSLLERVDAAVTPQKDALSSILIQSDYIAQPSADVIELLSYDGKTVSAGSQVFDVAIVFGGINHEEDVNASGQLIETWGGILNSTGRFDSFISSQPFSVTYSTAGYKMVLTPRNDLGLKYDMTQSKIETVDAPYNIFAIPYGAMDVSIFTQVRDVNFTTSADVAIQTVMSMVAQQGSRIFDVQILPYCPVQGLLSQGLLSLESELAYSPILDSNNDVKGVIINVPRSTFTVALDYKVSVTDTKIQSECDMHRLSSPNWASSFEFNVAKNGGIEGFNVSCTYKPFTPYIRVAPNFGRLYGRDFGDARGLVLGGDFSLPILIDNWESYQIQNKNYQLSFDRQIDNMEVKHKAQRINDILGMSLGSVEGSVAGLQATGHWAGAIAGGVTSLAGGIADYSINQMLRNEAIDYERDQFGYTLGNIQALPHTLSRVSAYNADNKLFPVLEYYTCTDEEKEALRNKIKYNGMTIMRIGTLSDYVRADLAYVKGKLIRIDDMGEDYHVINAIAGELYKGVFYDTASNQ